MTHPTIWEQYRERKAQPVDMKRFLWCRHAIGPRRGLRWQCGRGQRFHAYRWFPETAVFKSKCLPCQPGRIRIHSYHVGGSFSGSWLGAPNIWTHMYTKILWRNKAEWDSEFLNMLTWLLTIATPWSKLIQFQLTQLGICLSIDIRVAFHWWLTIEMPVVYVHVQETRAVWQN